MRRIQMSVRLRSINPYRDPSFLFGDSLEAYYTPATLYKDLAKTEPAMLPGDEVLTWADVTEKHDLVTQIEPFIGNGMPLTKVNAEKLNGYLVFGSGEIYDYDTGEPIVVVNGDPGVNSVISGFFQDGFDATEDTYTFFSVSKDVIADNVLYLMANVGSDEYRSLYTKDHHPATGNVLQNLVGANNQSYQGPGGDNNYHADGVWRVVIGTLSWTRARNAIWVNGVQYLAGDGLPLQGVVDSGSVADLLVPTDPAAFVEVNDSVPMVEYGIIRGEQTQASLLELSRFLGFKYNITVA